VTTEAQRELLKTEIKLSDSGKYDEALAVDQQVLAESPDNVDALYEMANVYILKKEFAKGLEIANHGAEYTGPQLAAFYILIGSAYDDMGSSQKAVDAYRHGIEIRPLPLLYYNMGVTLDRMNNRPEAKDALKKSAALDPNHASTQFQLGRSFAIDGYSTPALFALSRFLILEPNSARTAVAYDTWRRILNGGVTSQANGRGVNLPVNLAPKVDEGDFTQFDLFIGMSKATQLVTAQGNGKTEAQLLVEQVDQLFSTIDKARPNDSYGFVWKYYGPYFSELKARNFVEPFVYYISQRTDMPGVREWPSVPANRARGIDFLNWSTHYVWPKP